MHTRIRSPTRRKAGFLLPIGYHDKEETDMSRTKLALDVVQDLHALANSLETLVSAMTEDAPEETVTPVQSAKPEAPTEPTLTLVELRAFVAERSTPENRAKIKEILTSHGVKKLTELPEDQYAAVKREVAAL